MPPIPRDKGPDSTLRLVIEGYTFISERCRRYRSDVFQTRLLLRRTICMRGEDAARIFYDIGRFQRAGAAPGRIIKTLFGKGGVQVLDDEAHLKRKLMIMSLMTPGSIRKLKDLMAGQWRTALKRWENERKVVLFDQVQEMLCRAVCAWAGVPLAEEEAARRTRDIAGMIEGSGAVGPRHWQGRLARVRAEKWAEGLVEELRSGRLDAAEGSALQVISTHRGADGRPLERTTAAVELLNILRPTVAVARFVTFAAMALYEHPECLQRIRSKEEGYLEMFVHEVRRFYPFFPFVAARVRREFEWKGYRFPRGTLVLLDLYGTNHDARLWDKPDEFRPERFRKWSGSAFNFIPQGGGNHYRNHRCPGEWITIELMKDAVEFLAESVAYDIPPQDLRISMSRMPAIPRSRFVISNVRKARFH